MQHTQYHNFKEGKKSKLNEEQVAQLEAVGFQWDERMGHGPWVEIWEKQLEELKQYQEKSKTFQVPQASPLSSWYCYQHSQYHRYKEGGSMTLTEGRILELEKISIESSSVSEIKSGTKRFFNEKNSGMNMVIVMSPLTIP